jgi:GGDEF domain-containing protein
MPGDPEAGAPPPDLPTTKTSLTKDLITDQAVNPFEERVRAVGIELDIPDRFINTDRFPESTHIDPLTGLPIEEDAMRIQVAQEFTDCIKEGKHWVMVYSDADNLKQANKRHKREFGDTVIRYGAARPTQLADQLNLPDEVSTYAMRQTGAADETVMWFFGVTEDQIEQIKNLTGPIGEKKKISDPEFTFSVSAVALSSTDESLQDQITQTREFLDGNPDSKAFNLFKTIKEKADTETQIMKISKDVERLPVERLSAASGYEDIKSIIIEEIGDSRISEKLLSHVLDIIAFEKDLAYKKAIDNDTEYTRILIAQGMTENEIQMRLAENPRVDYYNSLIEPNNNA